MPLTDACEARRARMVVALVAWVSALTVAAVLVIIGVAYMVFVRGFELERHPGRDVVVALVFLCTWILTVTSLMSLLVGPRRARFAAGLRVAMATIIGWAIGPMP